MHSPSANRGQQQTAVRLRAIWGMPEVIGYPGVRNGSYDTAARADQHRSGDLPEQRAQTAPTLDPNSDQRSPNHSGVETILVTPQTAKTWLVNNNKANRRLQRSHAEAITHDITDGNWRVNVQPISFSGDPFGSSSGAADLLDGQHRLAAIVAAKRVVDVPVAINITPDVLSTYNRQHAEDPRKDLKGYPRAVQAAAKLQWRVDQRWDPLVKRAPSPAELQATIENHPDIANYFHKARIYDDLGSAGIMSWFLYHINSTNAALAADFLHKMKTGNGIEYANPLAQAKQPFAQKKQTPKATPSKALRQDCARL